MVKEAEDRVTFFTLSTVVTTISFSIKSSVSFQTEFKKAPVLKSVT